MTARFAAHNPPDVFYVDSSVIGRLGQAGCLAPLNSLRQADAVQHRSRSIRSCSNAFKRRQDDLRLPEGLVAAREEINNALLNQAGVKAPKTWAQLKSARPDDGRAERRPRRQADLPLGRLGADGCRSSSRTRARSRSTSPRRPQRQAVKYYVGLIKSGLADTPTSSGSWCGEALGKGKAAIIFEGNWLLPYMKSTYPERRSTASTR